MISAFPASRVLSALLLMREVALGSRKPRTTSRMAMGPIFFSFG
jgi:hypothetical protein